MTRVCQRCFGPLAERRVFRTANAAHAEVRCQRCHADGCRTELPDNRELRRGLVYNPERAEVTA